MHGGAAGTSLTTHFEPLHKLKAHNNYILKCLISPDCQQLATTSADKTGEANAYACASACTAKRGGCARPVLISLVCIPLG